MNFNELQLISPILKAVEKAGYVQPSPIQEKAIPPVLAGQDLLGCAQTGTGKTAAFALPILQLLQGRTAPKFTTPGGQSVRPIRALILTPTRELALQIDESFAAYGKNLPLRHTVIFGGVGQRPQVVQLMRGVDILVATPGRLNDLIGQGFVKLDKLEIFVLDEADRMLDMGFVHDVKKVIRLLPQKRQTLFFSATMPDEIVDLANSLLQNPAKVFVTPASTTVEAIQQSLYKVDKANKRHLLAFLLKNPAVTSALVFTRTKHGADRVVRELKKESINAMAIHGNKSQNARQDALARFKDGRIKVLVATDIAARGLDISELSHVFNYDLPNIPETYVHRIGRTGRAGHDGIAVSFCCAEELPYLADIEKLIRFSIPEETAHQWPMEIFPEPAAKPAKQQNGRQNGKAPAPKAPKQAKGGAAKQAAATNSGTARVGSGSASSGSGQDRSGSGSATSGTQGRSGSGSATLGTQGRPQRAAQAQNATQGTPAQSQPQPKASQMGAARRNTPGANRQKRPDPIDIYENRTGGSAIVTKPPPWGSPAAPPAAKPAATAKQGSAAKSAAPTPSTRQAKPGTAANEGDTEMSRNNRRRRGKGRGNQESAQAPAAPKPPEIRKNERGVFDFSDAELAEDQSIRLITDNAPGDAKYASFEDYLKENG